MPPYPAKGKSMFERIRSNFPFVQRTITLSHSKVHRGRFFTLSKIFTGIGNNASVEFLIRVGSQYSHHAVCNVAAGGDADIELYEGPTVSAEGTPIAAINNNRFSSIVADGTYFHTPTLGGDGTLLMQDFIPGGGPFLSGGGSDTGLVRSGTEFIMKTNTDYLLRGINRSGAAATLALACGFYEE